MNKTKSSKLLVNSKLINKKAKKAVSVAKDLGEQASQLLAFAKKKYETLDPKTKKMVLEGLAVTAGVVASAVVARKVATSKKKPAKKISTKKNKK